jgi:hypothetical protein
MVSACDDRIAMCSDRPSFVVDDHPALYNGWVQLQASDCTDAKRPPCRYGHTATVIGSNLYIFGGIGADGAAVKGDLHVVNTDTFVWSIVPVNTVRLPLKRQPFFG